LQINWNVLQGEHLNMVKRGVKQCPSCQTYQNVDDQICRNCGNDLAEVLTKSHKNVDCFSQYFTVLTIGVISFIVSLVIFLSRDEIVVKILGNEQVVHEIFWGGNHIDQALLGITLVSTIGMIVGLLLLVFGIKKI
jgi:hypothetical protein